MGRYLPHGVYPSPTAEPSRWVIGWHFTDRICWKITRFSTISFLPSGKRVQRRGWNKRGIRRTAWRGQAGCVRAETLRKTGVAFLPVASQVYPRKQDYAVVSALAGLGASLHKFAFDLRLLQSPALGELSEPFVRNKLAPLPCLSSAIPSGPRNQLAGTLPGQPATPGVGQCRNSLLERTLDDSANRRILLPESFLATDELLRTPAASSPNCAWMNLPSPAIWPFTDHSQPPNGVNVTGQIRGGPASHARMHSQECHAGLGCVRRVKIIRLFHNVPGWGIIGVSLGAGDPCFNGCPFARWERSGKGTPDGKKDSG